MKFNYDMQYDILYVFFDISPSYCDEDDEGNGVFRNIETDIPTGIVIFDFLKKLNKKL